MTPDELEKHLHNYARYQLSLLRGQKFDKKMLRFNEIVQVGLHWHHSGDNNTPECAEAGVCEAIEMCIPGNVQYIKGRGPLTSIIKYGPHNS